MISSSTKMCLVSWGLWVWSAIAWSCPFDEAGVDVTILAHREISQAVESGDFSAASKLIEGKKFLYEYFEEASKEPLYRPLLDASLGNSASKVTKYLDRSLVLEIQELLDQVDEMFDNYQAARIRVIKAKRHLAVLSKEKEPMKYMKAILASIGNPGLMGMGFKKPDKKMFLENKKTLLDTINKI